MKRIFQETAGAIEALSKWHDSEYGRVVQRNIKVELTSKKDTTMKPKYTCKACGKPTFKKDAWSVRSTGLVCQSCGMAGKSYVLVPDVRVYSNSRADQAAKLCR